jgi:hypothetical protein
MSQNDFNIANQGFPSFRSDLNSALQALASTSSGATAPATPYANQLWYDTSTGLLKIRNEANSAWINLFGVSTDGFVIEDKIIHSGDTNTSIRFPAADTVTVETNGAERMRIDSSGNLLVGATSAGSMTEGLKYESNKLLRAVRSDAASFAPNRLGSDGNIVEFQRDGISVGSIGAASSGLTFGAGGTTERLRITSAGNVGIGTTSPAEQLHITGNLRVGSAVLATPTGSAPMYVCRAWVNFNGTSTVAIRASGNVSSITDNGTGDYTVNFTTAMPDANYSVLTSTSIDTNGPRTSVPFSLTTSSVKVATHNSAGALTDMPLIFCAIFR